MATLCVNIDHVATVRQARRGTEPDPLWAVGVVEMAGSTGVTVHLREDRRHIQDRDVELIREVVQGHLNLEMAATETIVRRALEIKPDIATIVPERREEVTTEGGVGVAGRVDQGRRGTEQLLAAGIEGSLFLDPDPRQLEATVKAGARQVELHTGAYGLARRGADQLRELQQLYRAARHGQGLGLTIHAGHGLNYQNTAPVAAIAGVCELNIGHSIISRALFAGLQQAVADMAALIDRAARNPQTYRPMED
jgi:pyridoxine 5-phosphate synthase